MNNLEKMERGLLYCDLDQDIPGVRLRGQEFMYAFNHSGPGESELREELLRGILAEAGEKIWVEPPVYFAYGSRTHIGDYFYANYNMNIVDDTDVYIGSYVMFGPNVTVTATGHPVHPDLRRHGEQFSFPVHIGDHVWIGANVVILPGVTIGEGSVIGAGSVVTKDVPPYTVAVGNPCRVLREITEHDREYYYKDRKMPEE